MASELPPRISALVTSLSLLAITACSQSPEEIETRAAILVLSEPRVAMVELKGLLQVHPDRLKSRLLLGGALLAMGDYAGAESESRKAVVLGARPDDVAIALSRALGYQGKVEALLDDPLLNKATNPKVRAEIGAHRGSALTALRRFDDAERMLLEAMTLAPSLGSSRAALALLRLNQGRAEECAAIAAKAVAVDPASSLGHQALGTCLRALGRTTEAVGAFEKVAGMPGADRESRYAALASLAAFHLETRKLPEAESALSRLDRLDVRRLNILLRARFDLLEGRLQEARHGVERLTAGGEPDPEASMLLAVVLLQQGKPGQAEAAINDVLSEDPNNVVARQLLARLLLAEGKPSAAVEVLRPVVDAAPGTGVAMTVEASIAAGDRQGVMADLDKRAGQGTTLSTESATALARGYLMLNEPTRALVVLDRPSPDGSVDARREELRLAAYLANQDIAGARWAAELLARKHPADVAIQTVLGEFYLHLDDRERARAAYLLAERAGAVDSTLMLRLAMLDLALGDGRAAEARMATASRQDATDALPQLALAEIKARQGDPTGAFKILVAAQSSFPNDPRILLAQARLKLAVADPEGAVRSSGSALSLRPGDPVLLAAHANSLIAANKGQDALALIRRAAETQASDYRIQLLLAAVARQVGDLASAVEAATTAVTPRPESLRALSILAELQMEKGELGGARKTVEKLRRVQPAGATIPLLESALLLRDGQPEEAAMLLRRANAAAPDRMLVLREYKIRRNARLPKAVFPLEAWLAHNPDDATVRLALGEDLLSSGKSVEALRQYRKVLDVDRTNVTALNNAAWLEADAGNVREALDLAKRAFDAAPWSDPVIDTYGWALTLSGQFDKAIELLGDRRTRAGTIADIDYHYALALHKSGRSPEAFGILENLLRRRTSFPTRRDASALLAEINERKN